MESPRWHCTSCGSRFADETAPDAPRCPKCLKRTTIVGVVREEPAPAPVDVSPEEVTASPTSPARVFVAAAVPSVVGAILIVGLGQPIAALAVCIGIAPLAGFLMTGDRASRIYGTIASVVAAVGVVFGGAVALHRTAAPAFPMIVGFLPGLALFFALRVLVGRPVARIVVAFGALVTTAYVVTSC